jgi:zinc/manganese transport system substrate-binding protein
MGKAAILIGQRLSQLDSANKDFYTKSAVALREALAKKTKEWAARVAKTGIKEVVTYHKSLTYFLNRFQIASEMQLEPKPGIPPSAAHIARVVDHIKSRKVKLVMIENWYDDAAAEKLRSEVPGLKVVRVPVSVGGSSDAGSTEKLIEMLVQAIESVQ